MKSIYECGMEAVFVLACNHDDPKVRLERLKILEQALGQSIKH